MRSGLLPNNGIGDMSRLPCMCGVGRPLCTACREYERAQQTGSSKRGGVHVGTSVYIDGRLTYTRYSRDTINFVQRLYAGAMLLDDIAVRTGVPHGSIRRIVHMELAEREKQ